MVDSMEQISIAFINDKSPIINIICNDLVKSGIDILFRSENIASGLLQLSALEELPQICIFDLDFSNNTILTQLRELKLKYPTIKFIAHSDDDSEETVSDLLEIGFDSYLLIGSDKEDFLTAIEGVCDDKKYFSTGISKIARKYFQK